MKIHGTAKGAALSTKDFGVAFGGNGNGCNEATYTFVGTMNDSVSITSAGTKACGQTFASGVVVDKNIVRATFSLGKQGTPTGTIYCRIWEADATIVETATFGEEAGVDIADLVIFPNFEDKTFTFTGDNKLEAGYWIGCEYNAGDGSNRGKVEQTTLTLVADTSSGSLTGSTWVADTGRETNCSIVYCQ